ncbi:DnaB-like helicase C-terminal domain-containing protein [Streptomyces chilikensis]|uniref:DnaB-like helicase C-terminal domain-containing protein n=1 Tax=Streptomyces chilikensis TaxID=1194079 RepID=A0ABV3ERK0_9ACTN
MTRPDTPWPAVNEMIELRPGTVTTIASLPTAGRSTLTLNMALHNALKGVNTLYTSSELTGDSLTEKAVTAMYGIDLRHREAPLGGWEAFSDRAKAEVEKLPLLFQSVSETTPEKAFRKGSVESQRRGMKLSLWLLDTLVHFSELTHTGRDYADYATAMAQARGIAHEHQIPVVITAKALNEEEDEPLTAEHVHPDVMKLSDQVLLLHREGVYWTSGPTSNDATITRLKPATDPTEVVSLRFNPRLCRFAAFGINV